MPQEKQSGFREAMDNLPTLLDFDIVFITEKTDPALVANINKEGVTLMNKAQEKASQLSAAVERLQQAIREYDEHGYSSMRDGAVQRFEFCVELAWEATREWLLEQGYADINSPKAVMKQAYADGLLAEEALWLGMIQDRNLTPHIYDEATAAQIYHKIAGRYCPLLHGLAIKLAANAKGGSK